MCLLFGLPVGQLGFYDRDLRYVVEPGQIEVLVGTPSQDLVRAGVFTVIPIHPGGGEAVRGGRSRR